MGERGGKRRGQKGRIRELSVSDAIPAAFTFGKRLRWKLENSVMMLFTDAWIGFTENLGSVWRRGEGVMSGQSL